MCFGKPPTGGGIGGLGGFGGRPQYGQPGYGQQGYGQPGEGLLSKARLLFASAVACFGSLTVFCV